MCNLCCVYNLQVLVFLSTLAGHSLTEKKDMDVSFNNSSTEEKIFACSFEKERCNEHYRSAVYGYAIILIVFNAVLAVTAVFSNGLVLAAYSVSEALRQKPINTILMSLAVTDFLTGAISQPLFFYEKILLITNCSKIICTVNTLRRASMLYFPAATIVHISIITLDRYIAVLHSYRYMELVTHSRVKKVLIISWLAWTLVSVLRYLNYFEVMRSGLVLLPFNIIFILIVYIKIFREIHRLERNGVAAMNDPEEVRKARERKSAKTVAIVLGLLFACWVPLILFMIIATVILPETSLAVNQIMFYVASTFVYSNSSVNVFVYYWRNEEMRNAMKKVIKKITQKFNNGDIP